MRELLPYVALAVSLLAVAAFFWAFGWIRQSQARVRAHLERLFAGTAEDSLGELLARHGEEIRRHQEELQQLAGHLTTVGQEATARDQALQTYADGAFRHVYLHTYNVGAGGPESAVVVLTDAQGNGFLLSVLAGKTVRVYPRAIQHWQAEQLAQEDLQALAAAQAQAGRP